MKLEVGKTYVNRLGGKVKIIDTKDCSIYSFVGDDINSYTKYGSYDFSSSNARDLVEEVSEVMEPLKNLCLEVTTQTDCVSSRGDGDKTSYYDLPKDATMLNDLIKHKQMEHGIGEAFCALYRLNDNGEYKRNLTKAKFYIEEELKWLEKQANQ